MILCISAGLAWSPSCDGVQIMAGRCLAVPVASLTCSEVWCHWSWACPVIIHRLGGHLTMAKSTIKGSVPRGQKQKMQASSGPGSKIHMMQLLPRCCSKQATKSVHVWGAGKIVPTSSWEKQPPTLQYKRACGIHLWENVLQRAYILIPFSVIEKWKWNWFMHIDLIFNHFDNLLILMVYLYIFLNFLHIESCHLKKKRQLFFQSL